MKKKCTLILLLLLFTTLGYSVEICETDRLSIAERIENKTYPSVFGMWNHVFLNYPPPSNEGEWSYYKEMLARRDLFVQGGFRSIRWHYPERKQLVSEVVDHVQYERNQINVLNPNFLFLASMYYYGATPEGYPEDWPYWLRDESGNRIQDEGWGELLIDYTLPGAIDHFVDRAVAVAQCGIFDGIFMDWWGESEDNEAIGGAEGTGHLYHGNRADALVSLVRRIREAVGDDLLIIVNPRIAKIPRSAPYVNGAFMETLYDGRTGFGAAHAREHFIEIENALLWYEENFRYPQVNCLAGFGITSQPPDSPENQRQARVFTTLSLTHSNGYVLYMHADGDVYWYPFWDADLGHPIGEKGKLYRNGEGLFIREFTNGWAVYNRSGTEQQIELPEKVSAVASGVKDERSHVLPDLDGEIYLKVSISIPADINADGTVNILDLVMVANAFGDQKPDLNGDGTVNILDLVLVANAFGSPQE